MRSGVVQLVPTPPIIIKIPIEENDPNTTSKPNPTLKLFESPPIVSTSNTTSPPFPHRLVKQVV